MHAAKRKSHLQMQKDTSVCADVIFLRLDDRVYNSRRTDCTGVFHEYIIS